jgi:RNA processing factor Prp31
MENGGTFSRQSAQALVNLGLGETAQARIADLAGKCNEGLLTETEQKEYKLLVQLVEMISALQAKARAWLAQHPDG